MVVRTDQLKGTEDASILDWALIGPLVDNQYAWPNLTCSKPQPNLRNGLDDNSNLTETIRETITPC